VSKVDMLYDITGFFLSIVNFCAVLPPTEPGYSCNAGINPASSAAREPKKRSFLAVGLNDVLGPKRHSAGLRFKVASLPSVAHQETTVLREKDACDSSPGKLGECLPRFE